MSNIQTAAIDRDLPLDAAVGIVVIGRNEGERLRPSLQSATRAGDRVVYVDSGSKDGSAGLARSFGIEVIELDSTLPFTAARGRNAGFERIMALWPDTQFVQFIDGDCELSSGWIEAALAEITGAPRTAIVFGRRRERYPDKTYFHYVCDIEWDGVAGPAEQCGGDALVRVEAMQSIGGYDAGLIASEDHDLCHRIRRRQWQIIRLADEMTLHDVAMTSWWQWWQRNRRSGHAGAEAWHRRGREDPTLIKHVLSNLVWGLPPFWLLWPVLWWRVYRRFDAIYATHIVLGKVPHCAGQLGFWWSILSARKKVLIEYK